jgi:CBS domain-containing protein
MTILDNVKATVDRARAGGAHGLQAGRARLANVQARRQHARLLQKLGDAYYAEHRGEGNRDAVARVLAELNRYQQEHPRATPAQPQAVRRARDIMHPGAQCITEDDTLATAAQRMRDLGVGSLPICGTDDRLHGIITDRDIVVRCIAEGRDPAQIRASDLAQGTVYWVDAAAEVDQVVREMEDHQAKRLPVIDNHRLVGVISEADLARNLSEDRLAEFIEKVFGRP